MSSAQFTTPAGSFDLKRYPARKEESLRAWNGADSLLVEHLQAAELAPKSLLTVNDEHGALTVALGAGIAWTDSQLSRLAIEQNLADNNQPSIPIVDSIDMPAGRFAGIVIKVPKLIAYFEYQLALLAGAIDIGTPVFAAGMDKHLPPQTAALMEKYIGPTERHKGRMKARMFTAIRDARPAPPPPEERGYYCPPLAANLTAMANVFSREKLDGGSHFLIEQMTKLAPVEHAIDLACGNGILGLMAIHKSLCSTVSFCDESAMAVESARRNAAGILPGQLSAMTFNQDDGLLGYTGARADLILCNPPFHSNHTVQEYVGRRLLAQCASHLKSQGLLCVVANRHLQYLPTLKRGFSEVEKLAQNNKFIVWLAKA